MKLSTALFASVFLLAGMAPVSAHDTFRVIGKLTKPDKYVLEVKATDGQIVIVRLDNGTIISRDQKKVELSELKAGDNLVINALGDSYDCLIALDVRIAPSMVAPSK